MKLNITLLCCICFSYAVQAQINSGMLVYYPFNGNSGDSSGNANHATVTGAQLSSDRFNHANAAYHFLGSNQMISSTLAQTIDVSSLNAISVSAWIKLDSLPTTNGEFWYLYNGENNNNGIGIKNFDCYVLGNSNPVSDRGKLSVLNYVGKPTPSVVYSLNTNNSLTNGNWTHVVTVIDRANQTTNFYINGVLSGQKSATMSPFVISAINIGRHPDIDWGIRGSVDEFRLYNRALSQSDITALYNYVAASISTTNEQLGISVYPNPGSSTIHIMSDSKDQGDYKLAVYDMTGRKVFQAPFSKELDITLLQKGIYTLKISDPVSGLVHIQKLIKE